MNDGAPDQLTRVFVSYAREDTKWLDRDYRFNLIPFLMESLKRQNVVFWFDKDLRPGDEFRTHIEAQIDQAQIALLVVSQAFLNSEFIERHEMSRIVDRAKLGQMIIVPVLVEPCDWSEYPILADRQMVPGPMPLIDYTESDPKWAKVKAEILDGLKTQIKRIRAADARGPAQNNPVNSASEQPRREARPVVQEVPASPGPWPQATDASSAPPKIAETKSGWHRVPKWGWIMAPITLVALFAVTRTMVSTSKPDSASQMSQAAAAPDTNSGPAGSQPAEPKPAAPPAGADSGPQTQTQNLTAMAEEANKLFDQKQYAEALPLQTQLCASGRAGFCVRLGYMYQAGLSVPADAPRAVALYKKACNAGSASGCANLGLMYVTGNGVETDYSKAREFDSRACDGGEALGCASLANMYEKAQGLPQNYARALDLYSKACGGGQALSCSAVGNYYRLGLSVTTDPDKARQFLTKGCNMGDQWGCGLLKQLQ
jgi:TPR repeat protein